MMSPVDADSTIHRRTVSKARLEAIDALAV
jgi:hypothetical protein